jgi:hypothetical protein
MNKNKSSDYRCNNKACAKRKHTRDLITISEARAITGLSDQTLRNCVRANPILGERQGNRWFIHQDAISAAMEAPKATVSVLREWSPIEVLWRGAEWLREALLQGAIIITTATREWAVHLPSSPTGSYGAVPTELERALQCLLHGDGWNRLFATDPDRSYKLGTGLLLFMVNRDIDREWYCAFETGSDVALTNTAHDNRNCVRIIHNRELTVSGCVRAADSCRQSYCLEAASLPMHRAELSRPCEVRQEGHGGDSPAPLAS